MPKRAQSSCRRFRLRTTLPQMTPSCFCGDFACLLFYRGILCAMVPKKTCADTSIQRPERRPAMRGPPASIRFSIFLFPPPGNADPITDTVRHNPSRHPSATAPADPCLTGSDPSDPSRSRVPGHSSGSTPPTRARKNCLPYIKIPHDLSV